jgi:hypothetical protein
LRLLLVNPTIADKREHVHIGLGTVGTYVKQHSSHEVRILDFMACSAQRRRGDQAARAEPAGTGRRPPSHPLAGEDDRRALL